MRITIIRNTNPFFDSGASANRFAGLISGLLQSGCQVKVVVTGGFCSEKERRCSGLYQKVDGFTVEYTEHYLVDSLKKRRIHWYLFGWYHSIVCQLLLPKYFKADADYIWITNDDKILSSFNKHHQKIKGRSLIELNEYNDIYKYHSLNTVQYKQAVRTDLTLQKALSHVDCLAVMTNTLINHYKQFAKPDAKFLHLPMTVDCSRFENIDTTNIPYKQPYIAYTGSMSNMKDGVDILIKAFTKIAGKYPDYILCLAGYYNSDVEGQKSYVAEHKMQERIVFLGSIATTDVPAFLCGASVLAIPRPDSHQAQGGFPTKLGEYLATGNPACVTRVGEIPDYLEDNVSAFMAIPGDVDSFADALDRALRDSENAKRVGLNGRKVAEENFDAKIQAKRLADFLESNV